MPEIADRIQAELASRLGEAQPQPRLGATRRAVELLGDVHRIAPVVHITGTNGKTTTARIIEALLRAHGLNTGLFTSPHLVSLAERFALNGAPVPEERLGEVWQDIAYVLHVVDTELTEAGEPRLSYFEALAVLGFAIFADATVDVIVLEVGMGGEWDATNVADGDVAVFTPIALDHVERLGRTIEEIARTKAGIIKQGARVVTAQQPEAALSVLREVAAGHDATIAVEGTDFALVDTVVGVGGQAIEVQGLAAKYEGLLPLYGDHQAANAALAIAAVEALLGDGAQPIDEEILEEGLAEVTSPGRLQRIGGTPTVLVDGAHNPAGATVLAQAMPKYFSFEGLALVIGIVSDKDVEGILRQLVPLAERVIITSAKSERSIPAEQLAVRARDVLGNEAGKVEVVAEVPAAIAHARAWAGEVSGRGVLVTGSLILAGEALSTALSEGWFGRG